MIARGDCKQCAENTLALLGEKEYYHPHRPGATYSARWMGATSPHSKNVHAV